MASKAHWATLESHSVWHERLSLSRRRFLPIHVFEVPLVGGVAWLPIMRRGLHWVGWKQHSRACLSPSRYDEEHSADDKVFLDCFCKIAAGIKNNSNGHQLKDLILQKGISQSALDYMKKHIPNAKKYVQLCGSLLVLGLNANGLLLNVSSLPRSAFDILGARIWGIRLELFLIGPIESMHGLRQSLLFHSICMS